MKVQTLTFAWHETLRAHGHPCALSQPEFECVHINGYELPVNGSLYKIILLYSNILLVLVIKSNYVMVKMFKKKNKLIIRDYCSEVGL